MENVVDREKEKEARVAKKGLIVFEDVPFASQI